MRRGLRGRWAPRRFRYHRPSMRPMTQRIWLAVLLLVVGVPLVYPIWLGVASAFVADDG